MMGPGPPAPEVLKSDTFGTIHRDGGRVVRDTRPARAWARWLARHLLRRESRALAHLAAANITGIPRLLAFDRDTLAREWIEGAPMHLARPREPAYFREALRLLRRLHAANVLHNDLAKETNWLVTPGGHPALVDFQLASTRRRTVLSRARGYDDIRHLLKHKRTYVPERLTSRQKHMLARRSLPSRIWMATGKKVYLFITRRILRWRDREGAGDRSA
jgi:RIO-like serine/threonine protein kinase